MKTARRFPVLRFNREKDCFDKLPSSLNKRARSLRNRSELVTLLTLNRYKISWVNITYFPKVDELIILTRKAKVNENLIPRETSITWKTHKAFPLPFPVLFASRRTTCPVNPMNRLYLVLHPSRTARFLSLCQFGFQLSRKRRLLGQCRGCQPHSAE